MNEHIDDKPSLPTGLVYDEACLAHLAGTHHPESPLRLKAILDGLRNERLLDRLCRIDAIDDVMPWIEAVHDPAYVAIVKHEVEGGQDELSTGDTAICPESFNAALCAVGGVIAAVDAVVGGRVRNAFCAARPPGHHVTRDAGMGFCIFNNVAIAAHYAQRRHGLANILIYDWDVHHGNGIQDLFYDDPTVLVCSTHMDGQYPMPLTGLGHADETGRGAGKGFNINVPLAHDATDRDIIELLSEHLVPVARRFKPELVILAAGFDARKGDPMGLFRITDDGFGRLTRVACGLVPGARVISVLEGGYDLPGLSCAVAAHVRALMEF